MGQAQMMFATSAADVQTVILAATAAIYAVIMYFTRRGSQSSALLDVMTQVQSEDMRSARFRVYNHTANQPPQAWSPQLRNDVERVCQLYGTVGMLMRARMVPRRALLRHTGHTVLKTYAAVSPFIEWRAQRDGRNPVDMWPNFRWLAHYARLYQLGTWRRALRRLRHPFSGPGGATLRGL